MTVLFGYTHVGDEIPRCPCGDPGNYMCCERLDGPGRVAKGVEMGSGRAPNILFKCWCGSTMPAHFAETEIEQLVAKYGSRVAT